MGKLTLDTGFNLSGLKAGYEKAWAATKQFVGNIGKSFDASTAAIMKQEAMVEELKRKLEALSDIDAKAPIAAQLIKDLKAAEAEAQNLAEQYEKASEHLATLRSMGFAEDKLVRQVADVDRLAMELEEAKNYTLGLRQELTNLAMPERPRESAEQLAVKLEIAEKKLSEMKEKAEQMGKTAPKAIDKTGNAISRIGKRIQRLFIAVLVFNVLRRVFKDFRDYIGLALKENDKFASSFAQVKANLATAFQPILQIIIPALAQLMQWLAMATQYLVQFVAVLSGKSVKDMQAAAKNMDKLAKNTKKAGAEAKKVVAPFDEINQLASSTGGAAAGSEEGIVPEFAEIEESDDIIKKIQDVILAITLLLADALLVIGAILTFSGANIPLGIALMAAGAAIAYKAMGLNWDGLSAEMRTTLTKIMIILGAALLVVGAILTFSGANIPLGIALMALGAANLVGALALNWNSLSAEVQETILTIGTMLSGAALVIGAILLFTGANVPLGLGLMALGAVGLAAVFAANWDALPAEIQQTILAITIMTSTAILVLGVILAFTGANIPLGLGLIAIGAVGLAATVAKSAQLTDEVRETIGVIAGIAGLALTALGIVLLCFGIIPLGLALLVAGVGLIFTGIFTTPGKDMLDKIKHFVNGILGLFENMANGVITTFENMINWVLGAINSMSGGLISIPPVTLQRVSVPRLATGTVVPPNKEFMAILGDNTQEHEIVSPVSTMKQAVMEALAEAGYGNITIEANGNADEIIRYFDFKLKQENRRQGGRASNRVVQA